MHKCTVMGNEKLSAWKDCYQTCNSKCVSSCMDPTHRVDAPLLREAFSNGDELHDMIATKKLVLMDDVTGDV